MKSFIVFLFLLSFQILAENKQNYIQWPNLELDATLVAEIKDLSLKDLVTHYREKQKIPVLILRDLPKKAEANSELMALSNSTEEQKAIDEMIRLDAMAHEAFAAQFLPPFMHNNQVTARPFIDRPIILLGKSSARLSAIHEWFHSQFQKRQYPDPITMGDQKLHAYTHANLNLFKAEEVLTKTLNSLNKSIEDKATVEEQEKKMLDFMKAYIDRLAWSLMCTRESTIEEIVLFGKNFELADEFKLSKDEKRNALWKHWLHVDKLHDYVEEQEAVSAFSTVKQNRNFLSKDYQEKLKKIETIFENDRIQIRKSYVKMFQDLVKQDLEYCIGEMQKKKRILINNKVLPPRIEFP